MLTTFCFLEFFYYLFFKFKLKKYEFNFNSIISKDKFIGWRQKPFCNFEYHHRYLKKKTKIKLNNFGILDNKNYYYKKNKKKKLVIIFGDTFFCGFDYGYNYSVQNNLNIFSKEKNFDIIYCFQKNYSTIQMYKFYLKFFKKFKPDIIMYIFNHNHPRRNITIKDNLSDNIFYQIPFNLKTLKLFQNKIFPLKKDSLSFIDEKNKIITYCNTLKKKYLKNFLYNNLFLYSRLIDYLTGNLSLKNLFNHKLYDLEKKNKKNKIPYQWLLIQNILRKWKKELKKNNCEFIICRNFSFYTYGVKRNLIDIISRKKKHDLAFSENKLPENIFLKKILKKNSIKYYDFTGNKIDHSFFIHQRYGYFNKKGIRFYSKLLINVLNQYF